MRVLELLPQTHVFVDEQGTQRWTIPADTGCSNERINKHGVRGLHQRQPTDEARTRRRMRKPNVRVLELQQGARRERAAVHDGLGIPSTERLRKAVTAHELERAQRPAFSSLDVHACDQRTRSGASTAAGRRRWVMNEAPDTKLLRIPSTAPCVAANALVGARRSNRGGRDVHACDQRTRSGASTAAGQRQRRVAYEAMLLRGAAEPDIGVMAREGLATTKQRDARSHVRAADRYAVITSDIFNSSHPAVRGVQACVRRARSGASTAAGQG